MSITAAITALCTESLLARIGDQERANARLCLIDGLAVALAAADMASIRIIWEAMGQGEGPAEARVLGSGARCRADVAAVMNGTMVSLLLYDDNHSQMRGHPTAPVLPAILAIGEWRDLSLARALDAFVVGYEVECQLGYVLNPSQYEIGWHATATQGTFGATAAAGLLLGLDREQMARALGIAGSMVGGLRRNFGTMTMSFHSGLAASAGIRAARLAQGGFTASPEVFDGPLSLGHALSREWDPQAVEAGLEGWGRPFAIVDEGPIFKIYPSGRPTVSGIEAALEIRDRYGVEAEDIARVVCEASYMYPRTLIHAQPTTGLAAKTSLQYCVATALLDGAPTVETYTDAYVLRPELQALMRKIEVRVPPELEETVPEVRARPFEQPVKVTVETTDGRSLSASVTYPKGTPQNPVSEADLLHKFVGCTRGRLDPRVAEDLAAYTRRQDATVRGLLDLLHPA